MKNLQEGQSLFELVVAIAISALIVVAMVALATTAIKNSNYSKNKGLASTYAQQATEWLRGERDSNYNAFETNVNNAIGTERCLNDLVWVISPCNNQNISGTPFKREVVFGTTNDGGNTIISADVTVSWTDSGGKHDVTSATNFSDWR